MEYVNGVLMAVAKSMMESDAAYPELQGIARHKLVCMADAYKRQQFVASKKYCMEAFEHEPRLVEILDIATGSDNAKRIFQKSYGRRYPSHCASH